MLDPFAGGGTTLEVAREMGRHSIGVDLSRTFCDLMVTRLGDEDERSSAALPGAA